MKLLMVILAAFMAVLALASPAPVGRLVTRGGKTFEEALKIAEDEVKLKVQDKTDTFAEVSNFNIYYASMKPHFVGDDFSLSNLGYLEGRFSATVGSESYYIPFNMFNSMSNPDKLDMATTPAIRPSDLNYRLDTAWGMVPTAFPETKASAKGIRMVELMNSEGRWVYRFHFPDIGLEVEIGAIDGFPTRPDKKHKHPQGKTEPSSKTTTSQQLPHAPPNELLVAEQGSSKKTTKEPIVGNTGPSTKAPGEFRLKATMLEIQSALKADAGRKLVKDKLAGHVPRLTTGSKVKDSLNDDDLEIGKVVLTGGTATKAGVPLVKSVTEFDVFFCQWDVNLSDGSLYARYDIKWTKSDGIIFRKPWEWSYTHHGIDPNTLEFDLVDAQNMLRKRGIRLPIERVEITKAPGSLRGPSEEYLDYVFRDQDFQDFVVNPHTLSVYRSKW